MSFIICLRRCMQGSLRLSWPITPARADHQNPLCICVHRHRARAASTRAVKASHRLIGAVIYFTARPMQTRSSRRVREMRLPVCCRYISGRPFGKTRPSRGLPIVFVQAFACSRARDKPHFCRGYRFWRLRSHVITRSDQPIARSRSPAARA